FSLAMQAGKILHPPYVPMLREDNVRKGFFEADQLAAVRAHLAPELRDVLDFAAITGWRGGPEGLPPERRQVDFKAGEVRLDPGSTKNGEGRVFPMTADLRRLLEARQRETKALNQITPWVFYRMVADGRGGEKKPKRIVRFDKAWKAACLAAGCPGR